LHDRALATFQFALYPNDVLDDILLVQNDVKLSLVIWLHCRAGSWSSCFVDACQQSNGDEQLDLHLMGGEMITLTCVIHRSLQKVGSKRLTLELDDVDADVSVDARCQFVYTTTNNSGN
jgi:hypothetical protein